MLPKGPLQIVLGFLFIYSFIVKTARVCVEFHTDICVCERRSSTKKGLRLQSSGSLSH